MQVTGIIAEYNPFHKGHELHIKEARKNGADCIVAVLGSYFTQRGDIALLSKAARCEAAIKGGADLVIELPATRSLSRAQSFASGGVELLLSLGIVDSISFGCECSDEGLLKKASEAVEDESVREALQKHLSDGLTFAAARTAAVKEVFGEAVANVLTAPNNILATEYISAAKRLNADFKLIPVRRTGAAHDSLENNDIMSATAIRELSHKDAKAASLKLPPYSGEILRRETVSGNTADIKRLESAVLCKLKLMDRSEFLHLPDISEGLENRIYNSVRSAITLDGLYESAKSKRYTLSRIRRIVLSAFLGLTAEDVSSPLPYIRVLGLNEKGRLLLKEANKKAFLPIIMRPAEAKKLGGAALRVSELEAAAADMWNMAVSSPKEGFSEYKTEIYKVF